MIDVCPYARLSFQVRLATIPGAIGHRFGMSAVNERARVTGGTGFLGSHPCARLLDQECEVSCVKNYFTGTRRNIEPLLREPRSFHPGTRRAYPLPRRLALAARVAVAAAGQRPAALSRHHPRPEHLHRSPKVELQEGLGRTISIFDCLLSSLSKARKLVWKVAV
jgi:NAD-dependent epimerase/dehydratase family protein